MHGELADSPEPSVAKPRRYRVFPDPSVEAPTIRERPTGFSGDLGLFPNCRGVEHGGKEMPSLSRHRVKEFRS